MRQTSNIKVFLMPALAIVIIIGLMITVANFLFGKLGELNAINAQGGTQQTQLQNKLESLQKIDGAILADSDNAYLSLPDKNPAVYVVSQLKNYASQFSVTITKLNISGASQPNQELGSAAVQFSAEGQYQNVVDFVSKLSHTAPIMTIERVKVTQSLLKNTEVLGTLNTYWAPFPQSLPSVTEAVTPLTDEELKILETLTSLELPLFGNLPPAQPSEVRANPFAIE